MHHSPHVSPNRRRALVAATVAAVVSLLALRVAPAAAQVWTTFPTAFVQAVAPGDSGVVLAATTAGAFRYDGLRFVAIEFEGPDTSAVGCTEVLETSTGDVWVGTADFGLFRVRPDGSSTQFTAASGLGNHTNDRVTALAEAPDGTIWAGTQGGGLSFYNGTSWSTLTTDQGLPGMIVHDVTIDPRDGSVWAGVSSSVSGGLVHVVGGAVTVYSSLPSGERVITAVLVTRTGQVWVGNSQGIARLEGSAFVTHYSGLATTVLGLAEGAHGQLWCATPSNGIARFDGQSFKVFRSGEGPASSEVRDLLVDDAGVLWAGTANGLSRFEGSAWTNLTENDRLPADAQVLAAARDISPAALGDSIDVYGVTWLGLEPLPVVNVNLLRVANGAIRNLGVADGIPSGRVRALATDGSGGVWLASSVNPPTGAVVHLANVTVDRVIGVGDGLPSGSIYALEAGAPGTVWIGTSAGASFYDGATLRTLPIGAEAVPGPIVRAIDRDAQGRVWIATGLGILGEPGLGGGAVLFDPADSSYARLTRASGLVSDNLTAVTVLSNGDVWFGSDLGATRSSQGQLRTFTAVHGLPSNVVKRIAEGENGRVWVATTAGLAVFDGENWSVFNNGDGLAGNDVNDLFADSLGLVAACRAAGMSFYQFDRTPPRTEILFGPPPASGESDVRFAFRGGDLDGGERGLLLSHQFDGRVQTPFAEDAGTAASLLFDGDHVFRVWAKDRNLNVSPTPAEWHFTVDHEPPQPIVSSPAFNAVVRDTVDILGSVEDARFESYSFEVRRQGEEEWDTLLVSATPPAPDEPLARWNTTTWDDGPWELRVSVTDSLGLVGYVQVLAIVDNLAPNASVTSPARVDHVSGGRVFTTNAEVELAFPPNAFSADQLVRIDSLPGLPPRLGDERVVTAWSLRAGQMVLAKPATLVLELPGTALDEPVTLFRLAPDSTRTWLGGTRTPDGRITTTLAELGTVVALAGDLAAGEGFGGARGLDCQPRVVSPKGGGFDTRVAISFELGKSSAADVKVFDRAGRLVREVAEAQAFGAGRNVVFWDGKDGNGDVVPSGLYMVAVRVDKKTAVKTVAVANR